jgi:hypothetical protein
MQKDVVISVGCSIQNAIFFLIKFMVLFAKSVTISLKDRYAKLWVLLALGFGIL